MKILFLDIDGVVNCETTTQRHRGFIGIDPYMAFLIGKIQLDTGCEIVLSSAWRGSKESEEEIERCVVKLYDRTKHLSPVRGDEIKEWLDRHSEVTRYAIVDDSDDMLEEQIPNFFHTSWQTGITKEIAEAITHHLNS